MTETTAGGHSPSVHARALLITFSALALSACEETLLAPAPNDAGVEAAADAGHVEDASLAADAGHVEDAGYAEDAGPTDSGVHEVPDGPRACARPTCTDVRGTGGSSFTCDDGASYASTPELVADIHYSHGLAALGDGVLVLASGRRILRSTDYGCTWRPIATDAPIALRASAARDRVYLWTPSDSHLLRVDGDVVTSLPAIPGDVMALALDPEDPDRVRLVDRDAQLWTSTDGGASFARTHAPPTADATVHAAAFDPNDIDRAYVALARVGVVTTFDGGFSWQTALGFDAETTVVLDVAVSPASGDVVWLQSRLIRGTERAVWRSSDGGRRFERRLTGNPDFDIAPFAAMAPHPTEAETLLLARGTPDGLHTYRYDGAQDILQRRVSSATVAVGVIAFAPGDPSVMYIGVDRERINAGPD